MIKIYTLFIVFIFTATVINAQFTVGQKVLSGNFGFSISKAENPNSNYTYSKSNSFNISPSLGWSTKSNVLQGVGLSYNYSDQKYNYAAENENYLNDNKNNFIGINFFSERFFTLTNNFYFTLYKSIYGNYSFGKQLYGPNTSGSTTKTSGYNFGGGLAPGLTYQLTKRLLFDAYLNNFINVGFSHTKTTNSYTSATPDTKTAQDNFAISSSLSNYAALSNIGFGMRYLFGKK